jgi:AcrR family transcriptional regulator
MKDAAEARTDVASPRVRHLLASARAQFVERGFDAVSIDAIARTAGVSKETIYPPFRGQGGAVPRGSGRTGGQVRRPRRRRS